MPSPKKAGHVALLVQIRDDVHAAADRRRRADRLTWPQLVTELLRRWASGANDQLLRAPVRMSRPATPDAEEAERLHEKWMRENPAYARACTEKAVSTGPRYRSLGELLAATAAREGRQVSPEMVAAVDAEQDEDAGG
jgi:hypothetical protein